MKKKIANTMASQDQYISERVNKETIQSNITPTNQQVNKEIIQTNITPSLDSVSS